MKRQSRRLEGAEAVGQLLLILVLPLIIIDLLFTHSITLHTLNSGNKTLVGIVLYLIFVFAEIAMSKEPDDHKPHRRHR